jgi:hypothetical protein
MWTPLRGPASVGSGEGKATMHLAKILDDMAGLLEHWGTTPGLLARVKETAARPVVGAEYIHSKSGNRYTVLHVGVYCGKHEYLDACADGHPERAIGFPEGTELVIYVGHYDNVGKPGRNRIYIRPLAEWSEEVEIIIHSEPGLTGSRFAPRFRPAD